ncbi:MAG: hypothetical protein A3D53_00775 [Candidatus Magasanikbacteria bacterium RIFCSPHIGHO2_02_FULL_45_10]|uniref:UDP-N-acetylmuramate:L-alanyl-gamma-D-glutamyl-meso-diaminopimelate ligase n=1 Tax=Candidatus Magasanikbacteria bacterium RIFCSPHIGHO2_02_FULL_45_10 TaxID=1798679 RepID=A0A1F6MA81_9BACT|nr:MAG: hypothetical protein A3D53_00775 [Candidatus Magasanikbacteria bacterium RIFCSPHIGHO2_02_FULL_45_10]
MNAKRIHFIGICGVAMSAIALAFKRRGWKVTGSDVGFYPPISTYLQKNKVDYYPGWHPEKMTAEGNPDVVVVGNVASSTNPEWLYVKKNNLPYQSYPEIIQKFFIKINSIVCAGTYGKSSSATLLTWILKETGHNPSYMFGGLSLNNIPAAELTDSDWSVVEGDEYKASRWDTGPKFAYYSPTHLLLTSLVWDHADVYPTERKYLQAFKKLLKNVPKNGLKIISEQAQMVLDLKKDKLVVTYGSKFDNDYRYHAINQTPEKTTFEIATKDATYAITTSCLGDYMVENITGCFALAQQIGIDPKKIIQAIHSFKGMKRRLEKRSEGRVVVYDDIAHSPTKAMSVLETLKKVYESKVVAIFEPNTGNRRPEATPWYDHAFNAADEIIIPRLTKVKSDPHEAPSIEGSELAEIISKTHPNAQYIEEDDELTKYLLSQPIGTVVVFLGSHGFRGMIEAVVKEKS